MPRPACASGWRRTKSGRAGRRIERPLARPVGFETRHERAGWYAYFPVEDAGCFSTGSSGLRKWSGRAAFRNNRFSSDTIRSTVHIASTPLTQSDESSISSLLNFPTTAREPIRRWSLTVSGRRIDAGPRLHENSAAAIPPADSTPSMIARSMVRNPFEKSSGACMPIWRSSRNGPVSGDHSKGLRFTRRRRVIVPKQRRRLAQRNEALVLIA